MELKSAVRKIIKKNRSRGIGCDGGRPYFTPKKVEPTLMDWGQLEKELTWERMWTNRTGPELLIAFVIALLLDLGMTSIDVVLDVLQAQQYLNGTIYIKEVPSPESLTTTGTCTFIGNFVGNASEGDHTFHNQLWPDDKTPFYRYECFEKDPIYGCVTLFFFFVPGISSFILGYSYSRHLAEKKEMNTSLQKCCLVFTLILTSFLAMITFPLQFVLVSLIGLINDGTEWKKLASKIQISEALLDASLQYVLTLFVMFIHADRKPSSIQLISCVTNMIFLAVARVDAWLMDKGGNNMNWRQKVIHVFPLLPFAMTNSAFKLGSISFIASILRYNCVYLYGTIATIVFLVAFLFSQRKLKQDNFHLVQGSLVHALGIGKISKMAVLSGLGEKTEHILQSGDYQRRNLVYQNVFWFVVNCSVIIGLIIAVKVDVHLWVFFPFVKGEVSVFKTPVGAYINWIGPGLLVLGVLSLALTFHQCKLDAVTEKKEDQRATYKKVTQKKRQEAEVANNTPAEKIMQAIQARRTQAFDNKANKALTKQSTVVEGGIEGGFYHGFSSFVNYLAMMGDNLSHESQTKEPKEPKESQAELLQSVDNL